MPSYAFSGSKWGSPNQGTSGGQVTWSFAKSAGRFYSFDAEIVGAFQSLIREAFNRWESQANIDFLEVADSAQSDIRLGWDAIDGSGKTLAETTGSYYSSGELTAAEIRFDTAENWSSSFDPVPGMANFYTTALHEIGHAIGLSHTDDPGTIMYTYSNSLPELDDQDVFGAQLLYGRSAFTFGTAGPNTYTGSRGADVFWGMEDNDNLSGGAGDDVLNGNTGDDYVNGNMGNDLVEGGKDNDQVEGGKDNDFVNGNLGDDYAHGNMGNDIVQGGQGNDTVEGGQGNDQVFGNRDNDIVFGNLGNDTINGGGGIDHLTGGGDFDTFVFVAGEGNGDTITDFNSADDQLRFESYGPGATFTQLDASHWRIASADGSVQDVITIGNGAAVTGADFSFV